METQIDPVEGILAILDEGSATGTNKFGLLLNLIQLAPQLDPDEFSISLSDLAMAAVELHWDHASQFDGAVALRQVTSPNRSHATVKAVMDLKASQGIEHWIELDKRAALESASVRDLQRNLKRNPVARLQTLGGEPLTFLYSTGLVDGVDSIILRREAKEALIRYGSVLVPLVEDRFVRQVLKANSQLDTEVHDHVREHLFGSARRMPGPGLRLSLLNIQESRCVYSGESLNTGSSLDHMIPWSRQRVSTLENLTLTTLRHNSAKGRLLLAPESLERWVHLWSVWRMISPMLLRITPGRWTSGGPRRSLPLSTGACHRAPGCGTRPQSPP